MREINIAGFKLIYSIISFLFILFIMLSAHGCTKKEISLNNCWNINYEKEGYYRGDGFFITSMEGLSLQSWGCADQGGVNTFRVAEALHDRVNRFVYGRSQSGETVLAFSFRGRILNDSSGKYLEIDEIHDLHYAQRPNWLSELSGPSQ